MFDNNANNKDQNNISAIKRELDLLNKRVKLLEDTVKRMKNEQSQR